VLAQMRSTGRAFPLQYPSEVAVRQRLLVGIYPWDCSRIKRI